MSGKQNGGTSAQDYLATIEKIKAAVLEEVMTEVRPLLTQLAELSGTWQGQKREAADIEKLREEQLADFQSIFLDSLNKFKTVQKDELDYAKNSTASATASQKKAEAEIEQAGLPNPQKLQEMAQAQLQSLQKRLEKRIAFRQTQIARRFRKI
jgi:DNA anti-recombination protein RmuC